jgi:hypothetical protein
VFLAWRFVKTIPDAAALLLLRVTALQFTTLDCMTELPLLLAATTTYIEFTAATVKFPATALCAYTISNNSNCSRSCNIDVRDNECRLHSNTAATGSE